MTKLRQDITHEPEELEKMLDRWTGEDRVALDEAASLVRSGGHIVITGIGSSWHAGMAVQSVFDAAGRPARLIEASELLSFPRLPEATVLIVLSRSGRSYEILECVAKARGAGARIVAVTNSPDSPLAASADVTLEMRARFDHLVSVTMYSALALGGGLLAAASCGTLDSGLADRLSGALRECGAAIENWSDQIASSGWLPDNEATFFLARGGSLATAHEAGLLWEEAAKTAATAMTTGGFRHGPQEAIAPGTRVGIWPTCGEAREADLTVARDARSAGARVMLVGQDLPADAADLVINLPAIPSGWQFVADIIPAQLAAEQFSRARGVDCDSFRICPYVIEKAEGL